MTIIGVGSPPLLTLGGLPAFDFRLASWVLAEHLVPLARLVTVVTSLPQALAVGAKRISATRLMSWPILVTRIDDPFSLGGYALPTGSLRSCSNSSSGKFLNRPKLGALLSK